LSKFDQVGARLTNS